MKLVWTGLIIPACSKQDNYQSFQQHLEVISNATDIISKQAKDRIF